MKVAMPPEQKLILLVLASHCTEAGEAWPTLAHLARQTGYSNLEIQTALLAFEATGLVKTTHYNGKGPGTPNRCRLDLGMLDALAEARP
jgi:hypothetical protein